MEAQRYPDDFDGIVAGAPANHWTHLFFGAAWNVQALLETSQSYVPASKLATIEAAALAACGGEDGVIEDPLACGIWTANGDGGVGGGLQQAEQALTGEIGINPMGAHPRAATKTACRSCRTQRSRA